MSTNFAAVCRQHVVASVILLTISGVANAELFKFSYIFSDIGQRQPYAAGTELVGTLEGTVDPNDPDRVIINGFGSVTYIIPSLERRFDFASIEANEITSLRGPSVAPFVTFSGADLSFSVCPNGFTDDGFPVDGILDDCPFAEESGFLLETQFFGSTFATAADGTFIFGGFADDGSPIIIDGGACFEEGNFRTLGCRVENRGQLGLPLPGTWSLTAIVANIDPSADVDPTADIGDNTSLAGNVVVEDNVVIEENVTINKSTSIGSSTTIGADTVIAKETAIGAETVIGTNTSIAKDVVIQDGVSIGNNVAIMKGAVVCSGAVVEEGVVIGKNNLVAGTLPANSELGPLKTEADPADCP